MKPLVVIVSVLLTASAYAELPSLSFPAPKLELPSLSLSDMGQAKNHTPAGPSMADRWLQSIGLRRGTLSFKPESRMPIIKPKADIDPKMVVKPDESIDYKMIVKAPGVTSPRQPQK